jgi:site-specific DNA-methyltransferase (adenine-specific)
MHDKKAGRTWDSYRDYEPRTEAGCERLRLLLLLGLARWEAGFVAFMFEVWTEVDRVLKPGGFICAWSLPKTSDIAGLAMRMVGWERWDSILHLFGQGMVKAGDLGKKIDKHLGAEREVVGVSPSIRPNSERGNGVSHDSRLGKVWNETKPATPEAERWTGWSTQLAPGHEDWLIARKPKTKGMSDAAQVLEHGCGAMNVMGCAVPRGADEREALKAKASQGTGLGIGDVYGDGDRVAYDPTDGWPKNVVITAGGEDCPAKGIDRQSGYQRDGTAVGRNTKGKVTGVTFKLASTGIDYGHGGGGGASRFFNRFDAVVRYQPKNRDRSQGHLHGKHRHPTPKPLALMTHLVKLFAATDAQTDDIPAVVLDPFMGTGVTGLACVEELVRFVGIEMAPCESDASPNFEIAKSKIMAAIGSPEAAAEANEAAPAGAQLHLL